MSTIVTNPTPQKRFQEDAKRMSAHRDMVGSKQFEVAADFAMLEYSRKLSMRVVDGNSAAMVGTKIQGALEFLETFRLLAESPVLQRFSPDNSNLDQKA